MGCFVSTTNFDKEASEAPEVNSSNTCSRAAPPHHSLLEEETVVKEVLSETPKSKQPISRFSANPCIPSPNGRQNFGFVKNPKVGFNSQSQSGELSEDASEICSSVGERNDFADRNDDVTKIRTGSPGKYRNRDRMVGNSPGKRTHPSPGRSRSGPRSGYNGDANVRRIGSEMGQARRSTSPATRTDRTTRSMSSPGRCPSAKRSTPDRIASTRGGEDHINYRDRDVKLAPTNESLENPLVSLECFIFL